jgi:hypothetical protein
MLDSLQDPGLPIGPSGPTVEEWRLTGSPEFEGILVKIVSGKKA